MILVLFRDRWTVLCISDIAQLYLSAGNIPIPPHPTSIVSYSIPILSSMLGPNGISIPAVWLNRMVYEEVREAINDSPLELQRTAQQGAPYAVPLTVSVRSFWRERSRVRPFRKSWSVLPLLFELVMCCYCKRRTGSLSVRSAWVLFVPEFSQYISVWKYEDPHGQSK